MWAAEELRDRFRLDKSQAHELALCILWHTRSRAIFLLKCQAILQNKARWKDGFANAVQGGRARNKAGIVGSYIMNMVDPKLMGRMAADLVRATSFHVTWKPGEESEENKFSPEFVAAQCSALKKFLRSSEKLSSTSSTTTFLKSNVKTIRHLAEFALPQAIPVCYMMSLVNCESFRAAEAPVLDTDKRHYKKFVELGVEPKHFDLSLLVVALQLGDTPLTIENTGCEKERKQLNVHDFMLPGQMFYNLCPEPGCNYRAPRFAVYVKRWGPDGVWARAVRDRSGRWRHP